MELTDSAKEYRATMAIESLKRTGCECLFIFNSFICYNQLTQDKLTYLNCMVSVPKSLCSSSERIRRGRPSSEKKSKLASLNFDNEMHLSVKEKRRRCAYCSTKEANFRFNIDCFTCKLPFCL
jgi:hypothetical protein